MREMRSGAATLDTVDALTRPLLPHETARAFTTRRVPESELACVISGDLTPCAGDLVLARVDRLGHHTRIQLPSARRKRLFLGDAVILCYGNRYAPRQFEATVPRTLEPCHLVAAGGIAAKALSWNEKLGRGPTEVTPLGLVADRQRRRINVADWAIASEGAIDPDGPLTIAITGTAMHAGKTTSAAFLAHGLVRAGLRVGFAKITGTGAGGDTGFLEDAGAHEVLDFTDAGHASTYLLGSSAVNEIVTRLVTKLQRAQMDMILVELADGLFQEETSALLQSDFFRSVVDGVIFCAGDSMGAAAGCDWLRRHEHAVLAISGLLTISPLHTRVALMATGMPVLSKTELCDPVSAAKLASEARARRNMP
jgi:hypothetical protein